jgi:hypothetical protein
MEASAKSPVVGMKTHGMDKVVEDGIRFHRDKTGHLRTTLSFYQYIILKKIGCIPNDKQIHHIDFDKDNNIITNLQLLTVQEHIKIHNEKDLKEVECSICKKKFLLKRKNACVKSRMFFCSKDCKTIAIKNFYYKNLTSKINKRLRNKKYRELNKEKLKIKSKKYREENKDKISLRRKSRYKPYFLLTKEEKDKINEKRRVKYYQQKLLAQSNIPKLGTGLNSCTR